MEFDVSASWTGHRDDLRIDVRDLGSTNGMLIDGHKVTRAELHDGSQVRIGNTTMTVRIVEEAHDEASPSAPQAGAG